MKSAVFSKQADFLRSFMLWLSKETSYCCFIGATFRDHGTAVYLREMQRKKEEILDGQKVHGIER